MATTPDFQERLSALTLATHDMNAALRFYRELGFRLLGIYDEGQFATVGRGGIVINLTAAPSDVRWSWWGRAVIYVKDVDALHRQACAAGYTPSTAPANAPWGERYFHMTDPDGHELSFAHPLR